VIIFDQALGCWNVGFMFPRNFPACVDLIIKAYFQLFLAKDIDLQNFAKARFDTLVLNVPFRSFSQISRYNSGA
jgi:hypothetical protein